MSNTDSRAQSPFLCVCSEKCVKVSTDSKLERAFQSLALKRHLESLSTRLPSPQSAQFMYLPGAGIVYDSERCTCSVDGCLLAVFAGELDNYAYLVKKYCLSTTQLDPSRPWRLETIRDLSPLTNAQVVVALYSELGATFMSKLKGNFAFCIYDARSGRVLVVNDASASFNVWQGHLVEDHSLVVGCGLAPPAGLLESGQSTPIGAGEYKFGWRSAPISYASSKASITLKASDAMSAALAALSACAPSQATFTGPSRAQPVAVGKAASAHQQAKAALAYVPPHQQPKAAQAYVPPHKRASPASTGRSWRCSTESAQTGRTPPNAHQFVNRNAISMDQPRSHRSPAAPPAARVDVLEAPEDSSEDNLLEHRSVPINIPPKTVKDDVPIGKPTDDKAVHMPQQMLQSDSEFSSVHSTYDPSELLFAHQDSRRSQLQFSVSSASISQAAEAEGSAAKFASPRAQPRAHSRQHGGFGSARRWADRTDAEFYADWSADSNGVRDAASNAPETISSWERKGEMGGMDYLPSGSVQEAKRLLKHAALSSARVQGSTADSFAAARAAAPVDAPPAASRTQPTSAIAAALAAPANAAHVSSWLGTENAGVHCTADSGAPAIAAALAHASFSRVGERGAELTLAGGITAQANGVRSAFGGIPSADKEQKTSAQAPTALGTATSNREAIPIFGTPDQLRLDRVAESPDDVLGLSFSDHFSKADPQVPAAAASSALAIAAAAEEEPATVASFADVLQARELKEALDSHVGTAEAVVPGPEPPTQGVGASLARLNREVEEAHMAREVTRLMTQDTSIDLAAHPAKADVDDALPPPGGLFAPLTPNRVSSPTLATANPAVTRLLRAEGSSQSMHAVQSNAATTPDKPPGMGMRVGSFPMALAALLRGRSSPNLLAAAAGGSSSASPSYARSAGLRPQGASPAPLSPASSSMHLHRLSRSSRSPLQPGGACDAPASVAPSSALSKAPSSAASLLASNMSVQGSRTPSLSSLADAASVPPSPRAALPLNLVLKKLPADLLDELAGGSDAEPEVKQMLANLLYSSPCALCIVDAIAPDQPILYVNAVFELQTGYSFDEVVGRNCRFLQAPPGEPHAPSFQSLALKRAIRMGRSHSCKILNYAKDGTPLWNELSIVPVRTRAGDVSHYVGMQTFTHAHRPSAVSAFSVGMKSRQRSGSHVLLPAMAELTDAGSVPRSSSHALLSSMGGFSTPRAMVS